MARFGSFSTGWQLRIVLAALRRVKPILFVGRRIPGWVVLTKYADVVETLARDDVFSVCLYDQRMRQTLGAFFLGMDETAEYRRDRSAADDAIRPADIDRIRGLVGDLSRAIVEEAKPRLRLDVVADLAEVVHVRYAAEYYGIPGPDRAADVLRAFRATTFYTFNFWAGGAFEMAAVEAGQALQRYIGNEVASRKARGCSDPRDDLIARLLTLQHNKAPNALDDDAIRRTVGGVVSGSLEPGIGLFARVMDHLLDLPDYQLGALQRAARAGDDPTVLRHVLEAARFNPYPPYLYRHCTKDFVMAPGTRRERVIPAGTTVVPVLQSAMFDGDAVGRPRAFQTDRPDRTYLNFGHGQHVCLGRGIAELMLTEMAKPVLALRGLRRAPGRQGRLRSGTPGAIPEGYYTRHLALEFEA